MPHTQTAPYLDELVRALGEKVGTDVTVPELEAELSRYLEYGVPPEQARTIILKKFGVSAPKGGPSGRKTLEELRGDERSVNLLVRIVAINPKEITVKGEKKQIQYGIVGDESRTRPFTSWKILELAKGDVVRVGGAYTKEYQGEIQVNFGDRVQIEKADPTLLPPPPAGAGDGGASGVLKCAELRPGDSNVDLTARVLEVDAKQVQVQGAPKTVYSGILGDATGKVQFNAWNDFGLKVGEVVRIQGGYVKAWRGTPQFTFDERCTIERLAPTALPSAEEIDNQGPVPLSVLYTGGGQMDVTVEATLLEVRPGSGLVMRCPTCRKVLLNGMCREHAKVEGKPDLRIKAILDDGTGAVNCILGKDLTESLLGKTMDECTKMAKDAMSDAVVESEARTKLTARTVRVRGNVLVDEFGPMLLAKDCAFVQRDLNAAAEALLAELEGVA
jgi:replication factor A1